MTKLNEIQKQSGKTHETIQEKSGKGGKFQDKSMGNLEKSRETPGQIRGKFGKIDGNSRTNPGNTCGKSTGTLWKILGKIQETTKGIPRKYGK